ncbi:MAG: isoleucyl-tRNA synthetase, isoleucyl-tRNA synthetase [Parcubacteria group bacterium]|nr:isoleucyl-tRNA synthetase, isoleucyl-tRNA synthetase [Parcubacteria group bacterium]
MPEDKGPKSPRAEKEEKVLQFWKENQIFDKTLKKPSPKGEFVFFEGPPTANAKPALHHVAARIFKDALPRYKTMQGFHVERQAGWDTHGLPVELQIEKKLGLKSKKEIESYGVEKFNKECKESVFEFIGEWEKFTDRIGYWTNLEEAYFTYHNSYIESVWSVLSHVNERGLLYKDYKVLPWCTRCGTALSSHELAQGYQDVKDLSLYVKFKVKEKENTFILAWTTTPWTLPGNIALAVGKDIQYVTVKMEGEQYILAESRLSILNGEYEVVEKMKGSDLIGLSYEPLYSFVQDVAPDTEKEKLSKAFKVYAADFVTTEDGTGIVHTAVMYGQDDFELGNKEGLPKVHLVSPEGTFVKGTGWFEGKSVVEETLAVDILKDLQARGLYFNKENHLHSYPFCWRCKTRLIYYARDSWYIRMSELREELVSENKKINWEPEYIRDGRFGEWLREVKDWAISRERYWGTPMPIWQNADGSKHIVVDSIKTLKKYSHNSGNKYFVMRHGGTEGNAENIVSYKNESADTLTEEGKGQAIEAVKDLKDKKIDLIIASPFTRTKETAEIVRIGLGLDESKVVFDPRVAEVNPGDFDGKNWSEYHDYIFNVGPDWFERQIPNGESLKEVGKRVGAALYDLETTYEGKNILIITHGGPAWLAYVCTGMFTPENKEYERAGTQIFVNAFRRFKNAEVRELPFVPLPHDEYFRVDLHKPFIDNVVLTKDGEEYRRVKEVMDVWFDSGSVPFAQGAEKREDPTDFSNILYPADFISEAIDQTRGWFYTMHAIGVLMGRGAAYKNVICLGHLLDKDGKKMSKSIGNILDPWALMDIYGVDTLRLWMYSVNQPGESKNFDERSVEDVQKRIFNILDNVHSFYELYRDTEMENAKSSNTNVLDQWIVTRLNETVEEMTGKLDSYKLLEPVRALRDFLDDLSTWYLRRSRERIKEGDVEAKQTLYHALKTVSKLLAPFAPFTAEDLYLKLRHETDPESVHLEAWPSITGSKNESSILGSMQETRRLVTIALEARSKANLKVRQPLSELKIKNEQLAQEYLNIIKDELNVKSVVIDTNIEGEVLLNIELTPELLEEGKVRDIIRSIQEMRKEKNLQPKDILPLTVPETDRELYEKYAGEIKKATNVSY